MKAKIKKYVKHRPKKYRIPKGGFMVSGLGGIPQHAIPEIKVRYNRGKEFLGKIESSPDVADFIRKTYGRSKVQLQECIIVLYLNQANEIIGYYVASVGNINAAMFDIRIVLATALKSLSVALILAHNHPSGNTKPSHADKIMTSKAVKSAALLDIKVLDHVIVTKDDYYSLADNGEMNITN